MYQILDEGRKYPARGMESRERRKRASSDAIQTK